MEPKSNVIDIWERREQMEKAETTRCQKNTLPSPSRGTSDARSKKNASPATQKNNAKRKAGFEIVDFNSRREAVRNSERRIAKRTVLSEFVGCFIIIPEHGLRRVNMYDISESGIAFDVES